MHRFARMSLSLVVAWIAGSPAPARAEGVVSVFGDVTIYGQGLVPDGLTDVVHVGAVRRTVAAVRSDGSIIAWGYDVNGEVSAVPTAPAGQAFTKVFGGWGFTFFGLTNQGQLLSWGRNAVGQADVAPLPPGRAYTKATASYFHGGGLRDDGSIVMWGATQPTFNPSQQAQLLTVPYIAPSLRWVDFGIGYDVTLGLRSDGQIISWGLDYFYGASMVPTLPSGMRFTEMSFAGTFAVALRSDGALIAWGDDYFAQVSGAPAEPSEGASWVEVQAGTDHAFARDSAGNWFGWGTNFDGEADASLVPGNVQQFLAVGDYNVVLHAPDCFGDLDGSREVDAGDVGVALLDFGPCPGCFTDVDGDGEVGGGDISLILLSMGSCG
jgi:alpha-tubulin suppressor-like RCC1 family protein